MTIYQEKLHQLEQRTIDFSVSVIEICGPYATNPSLKPCVNQVIRSATSIGANYAEANNASSKLDFKNKIYIAKKESAETKYWLTIFKRITNDDKLDALLQEALELNLIFQKIVSTIKNGSEK